MAGLAIFDLTSMGQWLCGRDAMAKIKHDHFLMGEHLGAVLEFSAAEQSVLRQARTIAMTARTLVENNDDDVDTLLAEIEHGCGDLLEGLRVDVPCGGAA
jgi:hypothetical protein